MTRRDYTRLDIEDFGDHLIRSGDLDPVYIFLEDMMSGGQITGDQLARWLVAYWCFYHCGMACHASEHHGADFWRVMLTAAHNSLPAPTGERWPRGHERRHARGQAAIKMINGLRAMYGDEPEKMVHDLLRITVGGVHFAEVSKAVRLHILFGPWIAFKIGDMLERIYGAPINFENADVFMFKDPVRATEMLWRTKYNLPSCARPRHPANVIKETVFYLTERFSDLKAPPKHDRPVALQEIETVLCKWKSHMNGHYPLLNDLNEIHDGLVPAWGETAVKMRGLAAKLLEEPISA